MPPTPDLIDGPLHELPSQMKEASPAPMMMIPEIKEQAKICKMEKEEETKVEEKKEEWLLLRKDLKWGNIIMITLIHIFGIYGFVTAPYPSKLRLFTWSLLIGLMAAFGVTGGAHRYWTHRAYKATNPLKIILVICYLAAGQNSIAAWVKDHRVHHKYSETDADPHNSNRGFFFSHVGWLMMKKHPEVIRKGKQLDMSDIYNDPITAFAERHFMLLKILVCFVIPIYVPIYFWNEDVYWAFSFQISRYIYVLNATWSVNSFAHFFGNKPYNETIAPVENTFVSYVSLGEGWHNYHHVFPSDYRAAEIGGGRFNFTTSLIDFFARIGWAYDLKHPSESVIQTTIAKRGDGSHIHAKEYAEKLQGESSSHTMLCNNSHAKIS